MHAPGDIDVLFRREIDSVTVDLPLTALVANALLASGPGLAHILCLSRRLTRMFFIIWDLEFASAFGVWNMLWLLDFRMCFCIWVLECPSAFVFWNVTQHLGSRMCFSFWGRCTWGCSKEEPDWITAPCEAVTPGRRPLFKGSEVALVFQPF